MSKPKISTDNCFSPLYLELLCLDTPPSKKISDTIPHVDECTDCNKKHEEISNFYGILLREIQKPISNQVLDFAKKLGASDIKYGFVLCEPMPHLNSNSGKAFRTKLLFTENGKAGSNTLSKIDLKKIPNRYIALRAMTDPKVNNLLLFLWSPDNDNFIDWTLQMPGTQKIKFNAAGASKIADLKINWLDNKLVYFKGNDVPWIDKTRFQTINDSIFY
ncbi:hypothetical protein JW935_07955 [candidate division KSB1 bacterium]|nr:hypothetical protein [candidate division KSB1 bacterium]